MRVSDIEYLDAAENEEERDMDQCKELVQVMTSCFISKSDYYGPILSMLNDSESKPDSENQTEETQTNETTPQEVEPTESKQEEPAKEHNQ